MRYDVGNAESYKMLCSGGLRKFKVCFLHTAGMLVIIVRWPEEELFNMKWKQVINTYYLKHPHKIKCEKLQI